MSHKECTIWIDTSNRLIESNKTSVMVNGGADFTRDIAKKLFSILSVLAFSVVFRLPVSVGLVVINRSLLPNTTGLMAN